MKKKVWSKPRLVVLVRGRPEEGVLNECKTSVIVGPIEDPYCWADAIFTTVNLCSVGSES